MAFNSQTLRSSGYMTQSGLTDLEGAKAVARRLFDNYDKGRKGRLDNVDCVPMIVEAYKSFNQYFSPSSDDIKSYHRVLDRNGDGIVTYQDIEDLCIRYLCGAQQQQAVQMQDGQEFEKVKKRFKQQESVKRSAKPQYTADVERKLDVARRLFKRYDSDGSGFLNDDEVSGLMKDTFAEMGMTGYTPTTEDIRIWMQMADTNNDGTVSLEEYEDLVIRALKNAGIKVEQQRIVF